MAFAILERNKWRRLEKERAEKEAAERKIRELEKRLEDYERRNGS